MILKLSPQRRDDVLVLSKSADALIINGTPYDFAPLPNGGTLPKDAIGCEWICGNVERINGELIIPILLPHGPNPPHARAFPEPITVTANGPIALPGGEE